MLCCRWKLCLQVRRSFSLSISSLHSAVCLPIYSQNSGRLASVLPFFSLPSSFYGAVWPKAEMKEAQNPWLYIQEKLNVLTLHGESNHWLINFSWVRGNSIYYIVWGRLTVKDIKNKQTKNLLATTITNMDCALKKRILNIIFPFLNYLWLWV